MTRNYIYSSRNFCCGQKKKFVSWPQVKNLVTNRWNWHQLIWPRHEISVADREKNSCRDFVSLQICHLFYITVWITGFTHTDKINFLLWWSIASIWNDFFQPKLPKLNLYSQILTKKIECHICFNDTWHMTRNCLKRTEFKTWCHYLVSCQKKILEVKKLF